MARMVRWSPVRHLMKMGIHLLVPKHRIGVVAVPIREDGQVLLLRHVFHPVAPWGLPGGWLGRGEDPAAAAARELWEETGLNCDVGPVVEIERDPLPPHLSIAFWVTPHDGEVKLSGEILEARWCAPDQLPGPHYPFTPRAVAAATHLRSVSGTRYAAGRPRGK
jgi:ADP-ribose pyrophosphatase YjhB (NUDIX family)